jgi:hypothetical protein
MYVARFGPTLQKHRPVPVVEANLLIGVLGQGCYQFANIDINVFTAAFCPSITYPLSRLPTILPAYELS